MVDTIFQIAWGTPAWVYVIFFYLLFIGIKASQAMILHINRMAILTLVFAFLSFFNLVQIADGLLTVVIWMAAGLIGFAGGWFQISRFTLRMDRVNRVVEMPGTWLTLIVAMLIFSIKYFIGYSLSTQPDLLQDNLFISSAVGISGICFGFFVGRFANVVYRMVKGDFESLPSF